MKGDHRVHSVLQGLALYWGSRLDILLTIMHEDSRPPVPGNTSLPASFVFFLSTGHNILYLIIFLMLGCYICKLPKGWDWLFSRLCHPPRTIYVF